MKPFRLGDLVKVRLVPHGCISGWAKMLGHVGIIQDFNDEHTRALVQGITLDGRDDLLAFIAVTALESVNDSEWKAAAKEYHRRVAGLIANLKERDQQRWQRLVDLSMHYHFNIAQLVEIAEAVHAAFTANEIKEST